MGSTGAAPLRSLEGFCVFVRGRIWALIVSIAFLKGECCSYAEVGNPTDDKNCYLFKSSAGFLFRVLGLLHALGFCRRHWIFWCVA